MRWLLFLIALPAHACPDPVCVVPNDSIRFTREITFNDLPSGMGVGREIDGVVDAKGASFGERFLGQMRRDEGGFDRIDGTPLSPLTLQEGGPGQNLGAMMLWGTTILHGHGPAGFPDGRAVGEGAIAILFDRDQPALAIDILGGERGIAIVSFLTRTGHLLHRAVVPDLGEGAVTFLRAGQVPDIAGILIENADPEGIGIDNLRFEFEELMGRATGPQNPAATDASLPSGALNVARHGARGPPLPRKADFRAS